jgi:ribonuclease HII
MLNKCYSNFNIECGTDEAGRGCLAGPVTAAAIILQTPNIKLTKAKKKQEQFFFTRQTRLQTIN